MNKNYVAMGLIAWVLAVSAFSAADDSVSTSKVAVSYADLPRCVNSEGDIAEIQAAQKTNAKTSRKYEGYRNALRNDTPLEMAARLAYAETMAANCPKQADQIADLITSVIGNRVRIRGGDVHGVIFQRDQFASSLNIYSESRYRDFLCPKNAELWKAVFVKMSVNLAESKPTAPIPTDAVNYYLYRHSHRFAAPNWKLEEVPSADEETRECIRVFRNPRWK